MPGRTRILQVVEANVGGVRYILQELVAALTSAAYDVTVAYSPRRGPESEKAARAYAASGARVIPVPMRRSPEPWSDVCSALALWRLMSQGDFDIVHCHSSKAGALGRVAARAAGIRRCVYSPHAFAFLGARSRLTAWCISRIERFLVRWTSVLVTISKREAKQALELGMPLNSVALIPNGTRVHPLTRQAPDRILRIGAAGRLVRQKAFDVLVRSMQEVQKHHPEAQLVIVGDGPNRRRLLRLANKLRVRLELPGKVDHLQDWLASIDLFVCSSLWEGMPLALLEAVSCGVPVVATAVGGIPELVEDGVTGLLADPGDPQSLATRIRDALTDPGAAWERAGRAHQRVEEYYDIQHTTESYLELYDGLLAQTRPGAPASKPRPSHAVPAAAAAKPLAIVDSFPVWSETFVLKETARLRSFGVDADVFALRRGTFSPPSDLPVKYSRGPLGDLFRIGFPRPVELWRHLRTALRFFGRDPRWLLFALARTSTVILVARRARKIRSTSVHAHFLGAPTVIGVCAADLADLPLSLSPHASLHTFSPQATAQILKRAAFVSACWKGGADFLSQHGGRVHYIPHGVQLSTVRVSTGSSPSLRILAIARLVKKKGIDVLIDAVESLELRNPNWSLVIVGYGPLRKRLEQRVARSAVRQRIRFQGPVPHEEVPRILSDSDVLVVPSIPLPGETEGIPNVILEAFAAGVPIVASEIGGIPEVVRHGETGILVPPGDRDALAHVLLRICRGEQKLASIVAAARKVVERDHSWDVSLAALAELHRAAAGRV